MNIVKLRGIIKNIEYSHTANSTEYYKANLLVTKENKKEDLLNIKFKRFSNPYQENEEISLIGNIRTFNQKIDDKNKLEIYCFTYFDSLEEDDLTRNEVDLDGIICKSAGIRKTIKGKDVCDFILANRIENNDGYISSYIPCVAWGKDAKEISEMKVGDKLHIKGQFISREYKKKISEDDFEIRIANEININEIIKE